MNRSMPKTTWPLQHAIDRHGRPLSDTDSLNTLDKKTTKVYENIVVWLKNKLCNVT